MLRFLIAAFAFTACSPGAIAIGPDHPAHAGAQPGRLAGPPAALAAVDEKPTIEEPQPEHHEHAAPAEPAPPPEPKTEPTPASPEPKAQPQEPAAKKPTTPKPKRPATSKKPAPAPEAPKPPGHEHH